MEHVGFLLSTSKAPFFSPSVAGCMFDKVARHFYDDTCVVPEKVEGESCTGNDLMHSYTKTP